MYLVPIAVRELQLIGYHRFCSRLTNNSCVFCALYWARCPVVPSFSSAITTFWFVVSFSCDAIQQPAAGDSASPSVKGLVSSVVAVVGAASTLAVDTATRAVCRSVQVLWTAYAQVLEFFQLGAERKGERAV